MQQQQRQQPATAEPWLLTPATPPSAAHRDHVGVQDAVAGGHQSKVDGVGGRPPAAQRSAAGTYITSSTALQLPLSQQSLRTACWPKPKAAGCSSSAGSRTINAITHTPASHSQLPVGHHGGPELLVQLPPQRPAAPSTCVLAVLMCGRVGPSRKPLLRSPPSTVPQHARRRPHYQRAAAAAAAATAAAGGCAPADRT